MIRNKRSSVQPLPGSNFWIIILVLIGIGANFIYDNYQARQNRVQDENDCNAEKKLEIKGTIKIAFLDDNPYHKGFVLRFTNGLEYRPRFLPRWQSLIFNEGDSIDKKSGTWKFAIFKKGSEMTLIVDDSLDCEKLR